VIRLDDTYRARNLEAARHILAKMEGFDGLDVALVGWAERTMATAAVNEGVEWAATAGDRYQGPPRHRRAYSEAKREDWEQACRHRSARLSNSSVQVRNGFR